MSTHAKGCFVITCLSEKINATTCVRLLLQRQAKISKYCIQLTVSCQYNVQPDTNSVLQYECQHMQKVAS